MRRSPAAAAVAKQEDTVCVNIGRILEQLSRPARLDGYSIYRVPANVRSSTDNKKHYEPRLVSVGPYHRNKEHLRAMEDRKRLYLLRFLDDGGRPQRGRRDGLLQDCAARLRELQARARACYFESPDGDGDEFVEMLLLDGCFVLQLFIQWFSGGTDPVFAVAWNLPLLHTDLLMLENQIPYFVLLALYDAYSLHDPDSPPPARPKPSLTSIITAYFSEKGRGGGDAAAAAQRHLTSYVVLMDYLINTAEDVVILDRADVMENKLANEEAAAMFFNQLRVCSYINYDDHYLAPVYRDVDAFCRRKWPKYKAKFRRDYLNSPWAIVGLCFATTFAVITLFNTIVTILRTFFHVLH
uniref:Uncharacterized protein n=1 Tax=Oryza brachyantha TaxID=4533 RepID=J3KZA6_ORYBR